MGVICNNVWAAQKAKGDHVMAGEEAQSKAPKLEGGSCHHDRGGILEYRLRGPEIALKKKKKKKALKSF